MWSDYIQPVYATMKSVSMSRHNGISDKTIEWGAAQSYDVFHVRPEVTGL